MAEAIVESVVLWIGSLLLREANILFNVADQVQDLQQELILMQQYLKDADAKQESGEVCILIHQIRRIAYKAEDVIDTYILKIPAPDKHRFMRFGHYLHNAPHLYKVGKKIEAIQSKVQQSIGKLNACGVRRIVPELREGFRKLHKEECWRVQRRSYPYEDDNNFNYVVGLENDILKVLEVVGKGNTHIYVISIVGMGGCGKTTLARKLFNHPYVKECFMNCMAWVFISQEWNTRHIISEILRKVGGPQKTSQLHAGMNVQELVDKLHNILKEKLYLIVLDDVWQKEALKEILPAFPRGMSNRGSKIIITTRKGEIIQYQNLQRNLYIHEPQPLSEVESWQLFSRISLSHRTDCDLEGFERLGKEMLKKCGGLPLAIVALSGILNPRGSIGQWQQVKEAVRSRIMEDKGTNVEDLLTLSYDDLPHYLKPCFLLLGLFPEDCQIPAGMLIRMWIAEGFVATREHMSPEDVAMQFLEELSQRFMIRVVRTNFREAIKVIQLHDLLRDLCIRKAKEQSFLQICTALDDQATASGFTTIVQPRRAALHSSICFPTQIINLRSLVLMTRSSILPSAYVSKEMLDLGMVHRHFKLLRLLNLWGIKTSTGVLPTQIGSLIHLRYLGIRASNITQLPTSIGNLRNLLTLDYRNVETVNSIPLKFPSCLWKLASLRHLFLPTEHCWRWSEEKLQLSAMKNLQILWGIRCDGGGDWFSTEMSEVSTTLKKLKVVVSTERGLKAAFNYSSLMLNRLHTFHCEWSAGVALQSVNPISNNHCLHKLVLVGLIKVKLFIVLPSNLVKLELKDSMLDNEDPMVTIGALAHLKFLKLLNSYLGIVFICKMSSFPMLQELYLENLPSLNTWIIENGAMPCLNKLVIVKCGMLQNFPQELPFVATLQQLEYFEVSQEFHQKAKEYGWSERGLNLPHNVATIIEECDSLIDISSIRELVEQLSAGVSLNNRRQAVRELVEQLSAGVFLNNKRQKYWVMKQNEHYYNCFMLYASCLSLCQSVPGGDCYPGYHHPLDWEWSQMKESDGRLITVGKLKSSYNSLMFDVRGEFNTKYLSLGITCEIAYVVMVPKVASVVGNSYATSNLYLPGGFQCQDHVLSDKPRDEWMRLSVGKFETSLVGKMTFSLENIKHQLIIHGVIIEPKA